jgi:hypothetical protein
VKVWVVSMGVDYEGETICSVRGSAEAANADAAKLRESWAIRYRDHRAWTREMSENREQWTTPRIGEWVCVEEFDTDAAPMYAPWG